MLILSPFIDSILQQSLSRGDVYFLTPTMSIQGICVSRNSDLLVIPSAVSLMTSLSLNNARRVIVRNRGTPKANTQGEQYA